MNESENREGKIGGIVPGGPELSRKKKGKKVVLVILILLIIIVAGAYVGLDFLKNYKKEPTKKENEVQTVDYSIYRIANNELGYFDLAFLKIENKEKNMVYSPLSIKYALEMLGEGASGDTKKQIDDVIGDYAARKYVNSANMSFANALFVKDTYKTKMRDSYLEKLESKYAAEVIYDTFKTPDKINDWVADKTFNLIDNVMDDVSEYDYILTNALAIDMEWKQYIQATNKTVDKMYSVSYDHENYGDHIRLIMSDEDYGYINFNDNKMKARGVEFAASINKYDIIKELGEDNIRATIKREYQKWLTEEGGCGEDLGVDDYVNKYIQEISKNYKRIDVSTDFKFYVDDDYKIFEKELKEYNGTTLEYIAIMPIKQKLKEFVNDMTVDSINKLIDKLKEVKYDTFEEGKIYNIVGGVPLFEYNYELSLMEDLNKMGIKDVFDFKKADLSNMTTEESYINKAVHKANIEFSNEGIKASAVTAFGGLGGAMCKFEYLYEVPVETIDMTFNKPFIYIIRDKDTKESWFIGSVYEPILNDDGYYEIGVQK